MKKVVVIEDDIDTINIVDIILRDEGFAVITINRDITIEEIALIKPNLVLVDYLLPFIMGNKLCAEIKNNPKTKTIPVILYSANVLAPKVAKECNADAFIPKPFDLDDFINVIKRVAA